MSCCRKVTRIYNGFRIFFLKGIKIAFYKMAINVYIRYNANEANAFVKVIKVSSNMHTGNVFFAI